MSIEPRGPAPDVAGKEALLLPDEVCDWLRITKDQLYDMCQQNRIPHLRVGRRLRFRRGEINEYLAGTGRGERQ